MGIYQVDKCIFTGSPVRNLQDADMRDAHIIYETAEQLKKDLKHKIEAWVI